MSSKKTKRTVIATELAIGDTFKLGAQNYTITELESHSSNGKVVFWCAPKEKVEAEVHLRVSDLSRISVPRETQFRLK